MITLILVALAALTGPSLGGVATWYDAPSKTDAAAGPDLREMLGPGWRGEEVVVIHDGRQVRVTLTDWCACGDRNGKATLIDLDDQAFAALAPLGSGVIDVSVEPAGSPDPAPTLPPTDTLPQPYSWREHR